LGSTSEEAGETADELRVQGELQLRPEYVSS